MTIVLLLCIVYLPVLYYHPVARRQFQFDLYRWACTCLLMVLMIGLDISGKMTLKIEMGILAMVVFTETMTWIWSRVYYRHYFVIPINLEILQSRWGVWVLTVVSNASLKNEYHNINYPWNELLSDWWSNINNKISSVVYLLSSIVSWERSFFSFLAVLMPAWRMSARRATTSSAS